MADGLALWKSFAVTPENLVMLSYLKNHYVICNFFCFNVLISFFTYFLNFLYHFVSFFHVCLVRGRQPTPDPQTVMGHSSLIKLKYGPISTVYLPDLLAVIRLISAPGPQRSECNV